MTLGKPHLIASLAMVAVSISYNVWVFARPASVPAANAAPLVENAVGAGGPVVTGEEVAAVIDPTTIAPPPAVDLARAPEWSRNPFASVWQPRAEPTAIAPAIPVEAEPDLVVASILHSAERRLAVVNGRIVRVGDRIGSATIVDVQPRMVVVESPRGGRRLLELRTGHASPAVK
jgi:hypothetical protein